MSPNPLPRPTPRRILRRALAAASAAALLAVACGEGETDPAAEDDDGTAAAEQDGEQADGDGPITVTNCDLDITVDGPPERVVVLARAELYALLDDLGVADRVEARAGAFPDEYFDEEAQQRIADIPSLSEDLDESGHLQISHEAILAADPELVLGLPDGISRDRLADSDIPAMEQPSNCPDGQPHIAFDDILDQVRLYGELFGVEDRADELADELAGRIDDVEARGADVGAGRTAAALYPTVGGGTTYAYGTRSMSHLQLEAAGFTNVFEDTDERVFEVTAEELIDRDPDVLVLLHVDGEPGPVEEAIRNLPGASGISAVDDDAILVQRFAFGEYASPLVVDGLERIVDAFGDDG